MTNDGGSRGAAVAGAADRGSWASGARRHWPIAVVVLAASVLLFSGLDRDYLWADEGDTAVLARSILKFGVPTAWDGVTFTDSDFGARLTDNFVMVSHPWLQYYAMAAGFAVFGDSAAAGRVPFVLCGLLTIILIYAIVLRFTGNRWIALSASVLLVLSVQFLIYARQGRHYSLNAALTCLLLWQFTRLTSWKQTWAFALVAVMLFHANPLGAAPVGALGVMTLVHRPFVPYRRWFWRSIPAIAALTVPWLFLAWAGYEKNSTPLEGLSGAGSRLAQFAIECGSVTPLLGALVAYAAGASRRRWANQAQPRRDVPDRAPTSLEPRSLALTLVAIILAYVVVAVITESPDTMWAVGMRQTPAILPFAAVLTALAIATVSCGQWPVWIALMLLFGVTRAGELGPWTSGQPPALSFDKEKIATFHVAVRAIDRFLHTEQIAYLDSLVTPNEGTVARVAEFLRRHAKPGDILITNYEWEPLYFYTKLPQGMKVLPSYPIYQAARARQLPEYVFGAEGVRWIVWRRTWGAYRGQDCEEILKALVAAQIPIQQVAVVSETTWENRENLHFRRFPNGRYLFPWFQNVPDTLIFRVDWPAVSQRTP